MKKILATFKIEEEAWQAFKQLASREGTNASQAIIGFIEKSLKDESIDYLDSKGQNISHKSGLQEKVKTLESDINSNQDRIQILEKKLDLVMNQGIEMSIDSSIDNRYATTQESSIEESIDFSIDDGYTTTQESRIDSIDNSIDKSSLSYLLGIPKNTWFICCQMEGQSLSFWDGKIFTDDISKGKRYQTEGATGRGLVVVRRKYPNQDVRPNSLKNIEKILANQDSI